ncbi:MAG: fibronectin type III domain-containing protein [Rudaea sp.]
MIEAIVALLTAPLLLAVTKKKTPSKKQGRQSSRPAAKRATGRTRKKQAATGRAARAAAEEEEGEVEPAPPPPPPPAPVQAPGLLAPGPGESLDTRTPMFRWFYVGGASHFQLVWALDPHFHRAHILLTTQTAAQLPEDQALDPEATYSWRVRGGNEGGWGPWSVSRTFRTPPA